jgi:dTMP kinase
MALKGKFITFEGGEGSGKSTVIAFVKEKLRALGHEVITTREPGGCPFSEKVRKLVMSASINEKAELFLMLAARAEHIKEVIRPALEKGQIVLCDRFTHSTLAYQGAARGLGMENLMAMCSYAQEEIELSASFFLDIEPKLGLARAKVRGEENRLDRERLEFHEKVYAGFKELLAKGELKRVDAREPLDVVQQKVLKAVLAAL